MSYAKELGKQYNAGTAWSSLGTDRSAYEQSSLATHVGNFRNLMLPGFSEYTTSGPRQSAPYEQNAMENVYGIYGSVRNQFNAPPVLLGDINNSTYGLLDRFQGLPQSLNAAALAGKYAGFGR